MISRALSKKLTGSKLVTRSGGETLLVHRHHAGGPCCSVNMFPYADLPASPLPDCAALRELVFEPFSCVLCIASSDFGLFKFLVKCADDMMDSCSFGARFQSWGLRLGPSRRWVQFRHKGFDVEASEESSITDALRKNMHETVAGIECYCMPASLLSCLEVPAVRSRFPLTICVLQDTKCGISLRLKASSSSATLGATGHPSS
jgi:hypothetical protein